jgi:hypothetical protein
VGALSDTGVDEAYLKLSFLPFDTVGSSGFAAPLVGVDFSGTGLPSAFVFGVCGCSVCKTLL